MKIRVGVFFLVLALGGASIAFWQQPAPSELLKISGEMVQVVAGLRGLKPKAQVQSEVESREQIARYLNETVHKNYSDDELKREGRFLQKLGLIPADMDYVDFTLKLLTEQVGGYYDPASKKFFIAGWLPPETQKPVMVHELTHALQDQYFDVNAIMEKDRKEQDEDRALAHKAVMEGDGTAVMFNYLLQPSGKTFAQLPDLVFISQFLPMDSQSAVLKSAPMFLRESLVFPYSYGTSFLQKAWAKDPSWSFVDKIYSDLPSSTEQIMHPDKYLGQRDNPKPVTLEDPSASLGPKWKLQYRNVLGEFSIFLLLKQYVQEEAARRAAAGWGGDQAMLVGDGTHDAVFGATTWDTQGDAEEFLACLDNWLQLRYPKAQKTSITAAEFSYVMDGEYNAVQRNGSDVRYILGLPQSEAPNLKSYWTAKN